MSVTITRETTAADLIAMKKRGITISAGNFDSSAENFGMIVSEQPSTRKKSDLPRYMTDPAIQEEIISRLVELREILE